MGQQKGKAEEVYSIQSEFIQFNPYLFNLIFTFVQFNFYIHSIQAGFIQFNFYIYSIQFLYPFNAVRIYSFNSFNYLFNAMGLGRVKTSAAERS